MKKLLFIVGPTASGKSALAVKAAQQLGSEIISCDSMQIYKGMDIGTAKVSEAEKSGVAHHLIDIVSPESSFSVAEYRAYAMPVIKELLSKQKPPIICGGTGLYVNSILYPMSFSAANPDMSLRQTLLTQLSELGAEYMHNQLKSLDAAAADKIHPNDTKRLIRALEINLTQGNRTESELEKPEFDYLMIGLNPPEREILYERINRRVDEMFKQGLLDEVTKLLSLGVSFEMQSMQAIGYKEFKDYFSGERDITATRELIKKNTRNYAKRQLTWFRRYKDIHWFDGPCEGAINLIMKHFKV